MTKRSTLQLLSWALLSITLIFSTFSPTLVNAEEVFTIKGVKVDVTAATAASARQQALEQGQSDALKNLLKKLTLVKDHERVEGLSVKDAGVYVKSLEIENEKTSRVRYLADMTVHFKPDLIRRFLSHNNLEYAETVSKPLLVVPVFFSSDESDGFESSAKPVLWQQGNPWFEVWESFDDRDSLVPVTVPVSDLTDIRTLTVEDALGGNQEDIMDLATRYQADTALVATARLVADPVRDLQVLQIQAQLFTQDEAPQSLVQMFEGAPQQSESALMRDAVSQILNAFEQRWKLENIIVGGESDELRVDLPVEGLQDWIRLRSRIEAVGLVRDLWLEKASSNLVRVRLKYSGTQENLRKAFQQQNLTLVNQGGLWILTERS